MFNEKYNQDIRDLYDNIVKNDPDFKSFSCVIHNWNQMKLLRQAMHHNHYITSAAITLDSSIEQIAKFRCKEYKAAILQCIEDNVNRIKNEEIVHSKT